MSFFKKLMLFLNVIVAFSLFLACIVPYTSSASLAFISLTVPALVLINVLFFLYWLIGKKIYLLLSLSILGFGYFTLGSFIAFNGNTQKNIKSNSISLLSYNVLGFHSNDHNWEVNTAPDIVDFVYEENPEIVSFQEFEMFYIQDDMMKTYPYVARRYDIREEAIGKNLAIFSKYKIINKDVLHFNNTVNGGIYADILVDKDTVRVYNLHLESLDIRPNYFKKERSDKLFVRLRDSFAEQQKQAEIVRQHINLSPYPVVVSGDFNNTQFSKVYFNIKGDLKDSFLESGHGYGETIKFWKFPFRIDMILGDPSFTFLSHKNYKIDISDHEPIMATFKLSGE
ncbi:endonuclease/exonuclease/phosphatase family protein [Maribacter sp. 1_MG-2023]|uniref:endonuclease/exonuclease/phosphatase family protein n=1 Tax=Maribacter sp. 1_MG-2023 TaxID=3062677 RepID=UPI0026E451D8|nr:endonuclease/exonuclease/phosphatase family protein [Maribacter sp. 1_MG-2023]MDO6472244.1 endonuclease/exonuclease/phosphatase family protein [Maribacter sp. 1_MG-2023]